jgi:hypothetical protein
LTNCTNRNKLFGGAELRAFPSYLKPGDHSRPQSAGSFIGAGHATLPAEDRRVE